MRDLSEVTEALFKVAKHRPLLRQSVPAAFNDFHLKKNGKNK
jgi:hypothetical protein